MSATKTKFSVSWTSTIGVWKVAIKKQTRQVPFDTLQVVQVRLTGTHALEGRTAFLTVSSCQRS